MIGPVMGEEIRKKKTWKGKPPTQKQEIPFHVNTENLAGSLAISFGVPLVFKLSGPRAFMQKAHLLPQGNLT